MSLLHIHLFIIYFKQYLVFAADENLIPYPEVAVSSSSEGFASAQAEGPNYSLIHLLCGLYSIQVIYSPLNFLLRSLSVLELICFLS